jgi:hypothetical protein
MYRVCLQAAVWNKKIFLQLLKDKESPWQFETEASKRSCLISNPFLCMIEDPDKTYVHGPVTYYCTAITKGRWMRGALKLCAKENISIDLTARETETVREELIRKLYTFLPGWLKKIFDFINHRVKFIIK